MKKKNIAAILVFVGILVAFDRLDSFIGQNSDTIIKSPTTHLWIEIGYYLVFASLILLFQYLLVTQRGENKAMLYIFLGTGLLILLMYSPLFTVWFNLPNDRFPRTLFFSPRPTSMMAQAGAFALATSIFGLLSRKNSVSGK